MLKLGNAKISLKASNSVAAVNTYNFNAVSVSFQAHVTTTTDLNRSFTVIVEVWRLKGGRPFMVKAKRANMTFDAVLARQAKSVGFTSGDLALGTTSKTYWAELKLVATGAAVASTARVTLPGSVVIAQA